MRIYLALFDPAYNTIEGSYWTWHSPELQLSILDHFYYDFAIKHIPPHPNALPLSDVVAGAAYLDNGWGVVYRFFDGGRDRQGRPDRYVMQTAWFRRTDITHLDCLDLIESEEFLNIGRRAPSACPVRPPEKLLLEWTTDDAETLADLSVVDTHLGICEFMGADADAAFRSFVRTSLQPTAAISYTRIKERKNATMTATLVSQEKPAPIDPIHSAGVHTVPACADSHSVPLSYTHRKLLKHPALILVMVFVSGMITGAFIFWITSPNTYSMLKKISFSQLFFNRDSKSAPLLPDE